MTTIIILSLVLLLAIALCVVAARKDWPLPQIFSPDYWASMSW